MLVIDMEDMEVNEESLSEWCSLGVLVRKLDKTSWFFIDVCKLNADQSLPSQVDELNTMAG